MKKLFLCLSLLLAVFTTAAAQIDTSKEYRIKYTTGDQAKYMNIRSYDSYPTGPIGGINFVDYAESDEQIFSFEASGTDYKLKSKVGKYIYCQTWNVDAADSGTALTFTSNGDGTYTISWTGGYFKVQNVTDKPKATINSKEVLQDQISGYFPYCDADNPKAAKFELQEVVTTTVITQLSELSNNKAYTATLPNHSKGANGWAVNDTNLKSLNDLSLSQNDSDPNQQFAFLTPDNGTTYYLYSVGKSKYISNDGALTDKPTHPIVFKNGNRTGTFVVWYDANHIVNVGGNKQMTIDNWGPDGGQGFADNGNSIVITAVEDFNPEDALSFFAVDTDRSEELAPNFGKVDIEGIKVTPTTGTFSSESYGDYGIWASNSTYSRWIGKNEDVDVYEHLPLVTIKTFTGTGKNEAHRFDLDEQTDHTLAFVISSIDLASMTIEAADGYNIVGYCFDYTAPKDITDNDSYEGEITCTAGTHHVEVKNLNAKDVDIAFGKMLGNITISSFYVFVRKGEALTTEFIEYLLGDGTENSGEPGMAFNQAYAIASKKNPNNHLYAPEGKDMLDLCGEGCHNYSDVKVTGSDPYQQFMLIPLAVYGTTKQEGFENCFFLYNVGQRKFVSKEGDFTLLTKYPRNAVEIIAGEGDYEGYFRLNFNKANLLNVSTDFCTDESKSCVVTNNNESGDGNNFYIREVRDFREEDNNQLDEIRIAASYLTDEDTKATLSEKISDVLEHEGVGYPKSKNTLEAVKNDITTYGSILTCFDLDYYINAYKTTTEVNMPESGKAYRIKTMLNYNSETPTVHYLQGTADGKLTVANSASDNSTIFVAKSLDEANAGTGSFALVNDNGQFLVGARTGTNGFTEQYEQDGNNAALGLESAADRNYFGGFLLKTTEGETTYNLQLGSSTTSTDLVITYDAEDPNSIIADESGCSIFWLEEVSYPNTVSLRSPKEDDGKTYSSIWLPFAVEIPEGVRAYVAHVDEVNSQLVCREIKNVLPADEGAILIGEEALTTNLLPYLGDAAALENNDLKGTNTTLARNTGVTTFVLNGGKGEIGFYPYTGTNIAKYKAYVEVSNELAAQGLRFAFGPATDIESVITEGEQDAKVYYDLSGRRVAQPTKGLYIVNGKKMYIK